MDKPLCVFGILDNERGRTIAIKMRRWLRPVYEVHEILHDGTRYEYPALKYMQDLCKKTGRPCLYVHTRGAVNVWNTTEATHKMWREQFGIQWQKYFTLAEAEFPLVVAPFVDEDKETRYNGFVANAAAMAAIPEIKPNPDRMVYEKLFANSTVPVVGLLIHSPENNIGAIRQYLFRNYGN